MLRVPDTDGFANVSIRVKAMPFITFSTHDDD